MSEAWINYDNQNFRAINNSEAFGRWWGSSGGRWPRGSFQGAERLEIGQWPRVSNPPLSNAWYPESGTLKCNRERPCPWGGKDNAGVLVRQDGVEMRRGMCLQSGRCDCPIGQRGDSFCAGQAHRDAFGQVVWPSSQLGVVTYDPYQASNFW